MRWLVKHGADPNARCTFDMTPLSIAAISAPKEIIELLFELGASVDFGQPLHYAVQQGRSDDVIALLLEKGSDINAIMFESHDLSYCQLSVLGLGTPLHEAARANNERLCRFLLMHGAKPGIRDTLGNLPKINGSALACAM